MAEFSFLLSNHYKTCLFIFSIYLLIGSMYSADLDDEDRIGFPEVIQDENRRPADNRNPLFMPKQCQENEWLYPDDGNNEWVCDCKPGYLYYNSGQKCYAAFEQGPCPDGEILQLPTSGFIPVCTPNSCGKNKVSIRRRNRNVCVTLGQPCDYSAQRVYGVNATTMTVECLQLQRDRFDTPVRKDKDPEDAVEGNTKVEPTISPRIGPSDEGSPLGIIAEVLNRFLDPSSPFVKTIGSNIALEWDVCLPGCRRSVENKCKQTNDKN